MGNKVSVYSEAELLHKEFNDLLLPIQCVLNLQVNLGPQDMVPNDPLALKPEVRHQTQVSSMLRS